MPPPVAAAAAYRISYRTMTDDDLPFVAALYATTRAEEVAAAGWPEAMQTAFLAQQHRAQHAHYRSAWPNGEWLIVERDGAPIGRLYLAEELGKRLLVDISLLPAARGAGIGTAILTDLLTAGTMPMELHVQRTNPALRLYERFGFEVVEEQPVYLRMIRQAGPGAGL
jgi:ribosomal protein S18 acetylase RimI-like enzyme